MAFWFTSDTHFGHDSEHIVQHRGFASLEDMTEALVSRWNERVARGDVVYHLGDFAITWGKKRAAGEAEKVLSRLNGQKWLLCGNHDRDEIKQSKLWTMVKDYHEGKFDLGGIHKQRVVLSHYSMRVWNQMHRGSWMLHGHSHGNLPDIGGLTMDVGVDCRGLAPISLHEVAAFMGGREFVRRDHHDRETR